MRCWITLRSVTSREFHTMPRMCGLVMQLVPSDSKVRQLPSRWRRRNSTGSVSWRFSRMRRKAARTWSASSRCTRSKTFLPAVSAGSNPSRFLNAPLWYCMVPSAPITEMRSMVLSVRTRKRASLASSALSVCL